MNLARYRLETCCKTHSGCRTNSEPRWAPSRLLDITGPRIRLVHTVDNQSLGPYATLSHCWGREPFLVLTSQNKHTFEAGVEASELPISFRDAIVTARALGLQFLWIDCYCIIQSGLESHSDWVKESALMRQVYSNSFVHIGATDARSPFEGCFRRRDHKHRASTSEVAVMWRPGASFPRAVYRLRPSKSARWMDTHGKPTDLFSHALFERAWVFQERLLAPRMLHFTKDGISWECSGYRDHMANEDSPSGFFSACARNPNRRPFSLSPERHHIGDSSEFVRLYGNLIELYSRMHLTRPMQDKFVAFGGIAEKLASRFDTQYFAGCFRRDI